MPITPFHALPIEECCEPLVQIPEDEFFCDPVYFNMGLSKRREFYIRQSILEKIRKIQDKLSGNYYFLILDPWRSRKVQTNIFHYYDQKIRSEHEGKTEEALQKIVGTFVTPARDMNIIPPHTTGGAIDLTLLDAHKTPLNMGTDFDDMTERSRTYYFSDIEPDQTIHGNRMRLLDILAEAGLVNYSEEWWHFDYGTQLCSFNANTQTPAIYGEVSDDFMFLQAPNSDIS